MTTIDEAVKLHRKGLPATRLLDFFEKLPSEILSLLKDAGKWLLKAGGDIIHGLWVGIQDEWNGLGNIGTLLWGWFTTAIGDASQWLIGVGKDVIHGLAPRAAVLSPITNSAPLPPTG